MNKIKIFISLILFAFVVSCEAFANIRELKIQYDTPEENIIPVSTKKVLTGGVSQVQGLPTGMYGVWRVKGTLLDSNDYSKYLPTSSDIWILKKEGDYVTLINPQNGASATITVTAVEDNTATFTRGLRTYNRKDSEQVTLTLKGDTFYGTDLIVNETIAYGISMTTVARYRVNGTRISGDTLYKENDKLRFEF